MKSDDSFQDEDPIEEDSLQEVYDNLEQIQEVHSSGFLESY